MEENAHISVDQNAYAERYGALAERYAKYKERLDATNMEISRRNIRKSQIAFFLDELAKSKELVTEFSTGLWNTVVDSVTAVSYTHLDVYKRQRKRLISCMTGHGGSPLAVYTPPPHITG